MRVEDLKVGERYKLPRAGEVGTLKIIEPDTLYFEVPEPTTYLYDPNGLVGMYTGMVISDISPLTDDPRDPTN